MRRGSGWLLIAIGLLLILPASAFLVAHRAYFTLGTSFPLRWLVVAAAAGAVLVGSGIWIARSR